MEPWVVSEGSVGQRWQLSLGRLGAHSKGWQAWGNFPAVCSQGSQPCQTRCTLSLPLLQRAAVWLLSTAGWRCSCSSQEEEKEWFFCLMLNIVDIFFYLKMPHGFDLLIAAVLAPEVLPIFQLAMDHNSLITKTPLFSDRIVFYQQQRPW